jgi:hypothetical protein
VKIYTPPEGMERKEVLLWLCDACDEFPCMLIIDGKQTTVYNEREFDAFIDSFGYDMLKPRR